MTIAFVFPGQGSQSLGMLDAFADVTVVRDTFAEASAVFGLDLWAVMADAEAINRTEITQPLMLTADIALWRAWQAKEGERPALVAGHSLGEYAALVAAASIAFPAAIELVRTRAECMNRAPAGAMAAILGLDADAVIALCASLAGSQVLEAVNFNAPGQIVIAGHHAAIARAVAAARDHGAKRAIELPVSVASHCSLMGEAAHAFAAELDKVEFRAPSIPVLHNVDAKPHDVGEIKIALGHQLDHPVQWIKTINACVDAGVSEFYECGPGKVLIGLGKRIASDAQWYALSEPTSFSQRVASE